MARTPTELMGRLTDAQEKTVARLESGIDKRMDEEYRGGVFRHLVYGRLDPSVVQELSRRYHAWRVTSNEEYDVRDHEWATVLTFDPAPRGGSGTAVLPPRGRSVLP